jgi:hypothetical protein
VLRVLIFRVTDKIIVMSSEMDAQVSIYHISWERDYGFCCHIDEECAKELSGEHLCNDTLYRKFCLFISYLWIH